MTFSFLAQLPASGKLALVAKAPRETFQHKERKR